MHARSIAEPGEDPPAAEAESDRIAEARLNQRAREALNGNPLALRQFLCEVVPRVRAICRGVMGRDHADLEDAIQDCLVDVVRALPQFRFEADVSHYVFKITMRRAIDLRQRSRSRNQRHETISAFVTPVVPHETIDAGVVRDLLDEIGEPQSTVLRMRLMLGHSIGEIASITGVSVNTVKTRLRLGKAFLRRKLERRGEAPRAR